MWAWIGHSRLLRLGFHDDSLLQLRAAVGRDDVASQHTFLKHILNICLGLQESFGIKEGEKLTIPVFWDFPRFSTESPICPWANWDD